MQLPSYIWNFGLIFQSNTKIQNLEYYFNSEPQFDLSLYSNIQSNDIIWVKTKFLKEFNNGILNNLQIPIKLLLADGDESFSSDIIDFDINIILNNPNIIHIFAQNCIIQHEKITPIPIGIDYHTIAYRNGGWQESKMSPIEQENILNKIIQNSQSINLRYKRAFIDFHLSDTLHGEFKRYIQLGEDRKTIFEKIKNTNLIDYNGFLPRHKLWQIKSQYAFSICPHGNGLDTHRVWEDLLLGCIVIVKTSPLDKLYKELPVIIIKDWNEINLKNFDNWIHYYLDNFSNQKYREKLTTKYWIDKINNILI